MSATNGNLTAFACTVGFGKASSHGKSYPLPTDASPVNALWAFLTHELPSDGIETWWAGTQWRDDHRKKENFLRTFIVAQDLDHHDEKGDHVAPPPETAARLLEAAQSGAFSAQLFHPTPAGARLIYVLDGWLTDPARYKNAFAGASDHVRKVLESRGLAARPVGRKQVGGFAVDGAVKDLARMLYAPRMQRDDKGRKRDAEVIILREEPACLEKMEARAPDRRKHRTAAQRELARESALVRQATENVNDGLNKAAFALGQLVGGGHLDEEEVRRELLQAATDNGYVARDGLDAAIRTIESGLAAGKAEPRSPGARGKSEDGRPSWLLSDDIAGAVDFLERRFGFGEGEAAGVFQKDRLLVTALASHPAAAPVIRPLADETIRELAGKVVEWLVEGEKGIHPVMPPTWLAPTLAKRGRWERIRHLRAVVTAPTLLPDAPEFPMVLAAPGHDPVSGIILQPDADYPELPQLTAENAREVAGAAGAALLDAFAEFPFIDRDSIGASRAAALAMILTPVARHSYRGPSPAFASLSSTAGTGKTLLVRTASIIATGAEPFLVPPLKDDNEMRKMLLTLLIEGVSFALFDNVVGTFGSAAFSAVTTAEEFGGRVLGVNRTARGPFLTTLALTGNNPAFVHDSWRRIVPIHLEAQVENPEARSFRIPNLISYVRERRPELYVAALTILAAHRVAGCPGHRNTAMGSFEAWDAAVRAPCIWLGVGDPCGGRDAVRENADPERDQLRGLLGAVETTFAAESWTVGELIDRARDSEMLRAALLALHWKADADSKIDANALGYRLRAWRGRVVALHDEEGRPIGDFRLVSLKKSRAGVRWQVEQVRHA